MRDLKKITRNTTTSQTRKDVKYKKKKKNLQEILRIKTTTYNGLTKSKKKKKINDKQS